MDIKVSSITLLDREESKTKALATLVVNDEIAIHGIKVIEGKNGEFVSMPQKRDKDGNYNDIAFPITAVVRDKINSAVLERYRNPISIDDLQLIGKYENNCDIPQNDRATSWDDAAKCYSESPNVTLAQLQDALAEAKEYASHYATVEEMNKEPSPVKSKIYASLQDVKNNEFLKAAGQIVIDNAFVIKGVKVTEGTVKVKGEDGVERSEKKNFVNMPSYQTSSGDYSQYVHPITKECYDKINSCVIAAYQNIGRSKEREVTKSENAPLYMQNFEYAKANGEVEAFRASHNENLRCRDFLDKSLADNFDGYHLSGNSISDSVKKFGIDRTMMIVAVTVQNRKGDGRFKSENAEWAKGVEVPQKHNSYEYSLKAHSVLVDSLASDVRKMQAEKKDIEKSSHNQTVKKNRPKR